MKKTLISVIAMMIISMTMGFAPKKGTLCDENEVMYSLTDNYGGEVWVKKETVKGITYYHLMATNTTGQGHCLYITIKFKETNEKLEVSGYVPASAKTRKDAISIYHVHNDFTIVKNTESIVDSTCL